MKAALFIILILVSSHLKAQTQSSPIIYNDVKAPASWADLDDWESYGPYIRYIGYPKDSIYVSTGNRMYEALKNHLITPSLRNKGKYRRYPDGKILIWVYNQSVIKMFYDKDESNQNRPCILNCYAVMIKNTDTVPIDISVFARKPIALEIEDTNGIWKTIKEEDNRMSAIECSGNSHYFIKPNEIIVVTIPIIRSKHKNQRLRINKTYSNVFKEI